MSSHCHHVAGASPSSPVNISPFRRILEGVSPMILMPAFPYQLSGLLKSLNPSGVFWGFMPLLLNAYFWRKQCIAEISLSSWPFLFYLVAKSVNSSATFTHAIVSTTGLSAGTSSSRQRQLLATAGFWLPGSVAKVEPCLVVAVPAISCAWQADSHMPEVLQGVVRTRQTR